VSLSLKFRQIPIHPRFRPAHHHKRDNLNLFHQCLYHLSHRLIHQQFKCHYHLSKQCEVPQTRVPFTRDPRCHQMATVV